MLVLTRKVKEKIVLPGLGVTIEIVRVSGKAVGIGVVAPANVTVLREEVMRREGLADGD